MNKKIYCVDTSKEVTPIMVRDAIIECFIMAHAEILEMMKEFQEFKTKKEFEDMKQLDIRLLVEKQFQELDLDFSNPTKQDLIDVVAKLSEHATNFRKPDVIKKHYNEIMVLINILKD